MRRATRQDVFVGRDPRQARPRQISAPPRRTPSLPRATSRAGGCRTSPRETRSRAIDLQPRIVGPREPCPRLGPHADAPAGARPSRTAAAGSGDRTARSASSTWPRCAASDTPGRRVPAARARRRAASPCRPRRSRDPSRPAPAAADRVASRSGSIHASLCQTCRSRRSSSANARRSMR